jgi:hypothetical protein
MAESPKVNPSTRRKASYLSFGLDPDHPDSQLQGMRTSGGPHVTPRRRSRRRQNCLGGCLSIGGALLAFSCVALIAASFILPSLYRSQRPEIQSIWCSRAQRVNADFVCDWKPTPPFESLPTLSSAPADGQPTLDPFLILTPATATPASGNSSGASGPSATPIGTEASLNSTPFQMDAAQNFVVITATPSQTPALSATPQPLAVQAQTSPTPTLAPSATPSPTQAASPTALPLPASYKLETQRLTFQYQTWNNCGPANLSMALSFFGYGNNQEVAARFLKPNREDKNVSPYQMAQYVNEQVSSVPVRALYRVGGDLTLLKALLANNFPVVVEKGYDVDDLGWMGHYLFLIGYDDAKGQFYGYDSYLGHGNLQGLPESYSSLEYYWEHFNNTFIVLYDPAREAELMALLGPRADPLEATRYALEVAKNKVSANPNDNWAWFNVGSAYTHLGDYERGAQAFDQAFILGMPWRTLWYLHDPYIAYFAMGRYEDILAHTQATESTTVYVEETFYYRGAVYAMQGDANRAIDQFTAALQYNNNFQAARIAREAVQNGTFSQDLVLTLSMGVGG